MSVPEHVEANWDATSEALAHVRGFLVAMQCVFESDPDLEDRDRRRALRLLLDEAEIAASVAKHRHRREWVGLGGDSPFMSDEDKAMARGEAVALN